MKLRFTPILSALGLAVAMSIAGCETQKKTSTASTTTEQRPVSSVMSKDWPTMRSSDSLVWTSQAFPTGDSRTSALGIEKGVPSEVRVNEDFKYQIIVTNLTDNALESVMVHDVPGEGLQLKSSDPQGNMKNGEATWNIGDMGPRQSRVINVNAAAVAEGRVSSCADVSYAFDALHVRPGSFAEAAAHQARTRGSPQVRKHYLHI